MAREFKFSESEESFISSTTRSSDKNDQRETLLDKESDGSGRSDPIPASNSASSISIGKVFGGIIGLGISGYCLYGVIKIIEYNNLVSQYSMSGVAENMTPRLIIMIIIGVASLIEAIWSFATCRNAR